MDGKLREDNVLEPLTLPTEIKITSSALESSDDLIKCLFCNEIFSLKYGYHHKKLMQHFLLKHNFVIDNVKLITDFKSYIEYWRKRFAEYPITEFCPVVKTNCKETDYGTSENFYLLCDYLPEDKALREKLQRKRLDFILEKQQKERSDTTFKRSCLFCKKIFEGNRMDLFIHMAADHNFNVGHSDNIVFGDELLNILEEKLEKLQCLYCERIFKNWHALKEHMRKKQHKRIRPDNTAYDKFYVINYLEVGKNWETIQNECDVFIQSPVEDSDEEWRDWEEESPGAMCFFCDFTSSDIDELIRHMNEVHKFDYNSIKSTLKLTFYQQVKLVNYIRRQMHLKNCFHCSRNFSSRKELNSHMIDTGHISFIPSKDVWDQPKYYFPTYENDNLLYSLDDIDCLQVNDSDPPILPEEIKMPFSSILLDENIRNDLLK